MHAERGIVHGGCEHQVARGEAAALFEEQLPGVKIDALQAHIAALGRWLVDRDLIAIAGGQFLDDHGVAAARHHAAGEDARGFACADLAVERMAGGDLADQLQLDGSLRDISGAHGIAVHGGHSGGRLGAKRLQILGEDAAERVVEAGRFRGQRHGICQYTGERFSDRKQFRLSRTIVARLAAAFYRSGGCLRCARRVPPP